MCNISPKIKMQLDFKWGFQNSKMESLERVKGRRVITFDLLAGTTCPAASICQSWANEDGTVKLGKHAEFVCYAAKTESHYPNSYRAHKHNFDLIREMLQGPDGAERIADMLERDLRLINPGIVRIHSSGDLFHPVYAMAWIEVARRMPDVLFFGYTKIYARYRLMNDVRLPNLAFVFSLGSRDDKFVTPRDVTCTVVTDGATLSPDGKFFCNARGEWEPILCGNHEDDSDYAADFDYVMSGRSFGIGVH